jgi:integrase/recombinase XerC
MPMASERPTFEGRDMGMIDRYAEHLRELGRATSTIDDYLKTLHRADRQLPAGLIQASDPELRTWLYRAGLAKASWHQYRAAIVGFFAFASDPSVHPHLDYNPAAHLPRVSVPTGYARPVPTGALGDILERAEPVNYGWFLLASHAGARCTEIADLDRDDIREDSTKLHGKGDKTRLVPTHELVWEWAQSLPRGPIAVGKNGVRLTRKQLSRQGNAALAGLGYPSFTMHMLRHWFGTEAYDATADLVAVQELLGHASPNTTRIYVDVSRERKSAAVRGLRSVGRAGQVRRQDPARA